MSKGNRNIAIALVVVAAGIVAALSIFNRQEEAPQRTSTHEIRGKNGAIEERRGVMELDDGTVLAHGFRVIYYPDGTTKMEMEYREGKQVGRATFWHPNGQKALEGDYIDEKRNGSITSWHPNGQKASEGTFQDGVPDGTLTTWLEDGTKFEQGEYEAGKRHGTMKLYGDDGRVTRVRYKDGKVVR